MDMLKSLGLQIASRRSERGLSQEDLAGAAEMDRSFLSEIENGRKNPSVMSLVRIAKALDVQPGDLLDKALSDRAR